MSLEIKGLNNLDKLLNNIQNEAKKLDGSSVSFDELFSSSFMRRYTKFSSFQELLQAGNFVVNSKKDFEAIPDDEFDIHIKNSTNFNSWKDMQSEAMKAHITKKLNF